MARPAAATTMHMHKCRVQTSNSLATSQGKTLGHTQQTRAGSCTKPTHRLPGNRQTVNHTGTTSPVPFQADRKGYRGAPLTVGPLTPINPSTKMTAEPAHLPTQKGTQEHSPQDTDHQPSGVGKPSLDPYSVRQMQLYAGTGPASPSRLMSLLHIMTEK